MKRIITVSIALFCVNVLLAQEVDLFKTMNEEAAKKDSLTKEYVEATFKSTHLINGHSIETTKAGLLDFRISHRFGLINQGSYQFFGLDNATERLGLDYGITNNLGIGIGRSTFQKQMDGFVKMKLLKQSTGNHASPVSITGLAAVIIKTLKEADPNIKRTTGDKTSYVYQLIIAKKFSPKTSVQLLPTFVHYNLVPLANDPNDLYSLGIGARQKVSKRLSITAEYYYQFNQFSGFYNSLAIGVDIETGGHVFQLHFTNSTGMTESTFINQTTGKWADGDVHFGFNISRVFKIKKQKLTP
ncbi:MAG: hypothetical protein H7101_01520 [Deinococcales bacterium]|nr:hypothetical protein [Chitinophagaceae bacterium]